jgi:hypothetical protein
MVANKENYMYIQFDIYKIDKLSNYKQFTRRKPWNSQDP